MHWNKPQLENKCSLLSDDIDMVENVGTRYPSSRLKWMS